MNQLSVEAIKLFNVSELKSNGVWQYKEGKKELFRRLTDAIQQGNSDT